EDGIRDDLVTGVQTCALPISRVHLLSQLQQDAGRRLRMHERDTPAAGAAPRHLVDETIPRRPAALERLVQVRHAVADMMDAGPRSEERRVGKECGGRRERERW